MSWLSGPCAAPTESDTRPPIVSANLAIRGDNELVVAVTILNPDDMLPVTALLPLEHACELRDSLDWTLRQLEL